MEVKRTERSLRLKINWLEKGIEVMAQNVEEN